MSVKRGRRQAREASEEIVRLNAEIERLNEENEQSSNDVLRLKEELAICLNDHCNIELEKEIERLKKELAESKQPKRATKK